MPRQRGFNTHMGYMGGGEDYYTKIQRGIRDFWLNDEAFPDNGEYSLARFTSFVMYSM